MSATELGMYSVIRFSAARRSIEQMRVLGAAVDAIRPGAFPGIRKANDGFCCEISDAATWDAHAQAISRWIIEFHSAIRTALATGVSVTVDVAVEPEDHDGKNPMLVLSLDGGLMTNLSNAGIRFEISIY